MKPEKKIGKSRAEMCLWLQAISGKICDLDGKGVRIAVEQLEKKSEILAAILVGVSLLILTNF